MTSGGTLEAESNVTRDEAARLHSLRQSKLLDTPEDQRFDIFTRIASQIFGVPISLVTLVDAHRQWFKSAVGAPQGLSQPRDISFCTHALQNPDKILLVEDALQDARFAANPLVIGSPGVRFYAGAPVLDEQGRGLGTLCIIDTKARTLTDQERSTLRDLAFAVSSIIRMEQATVAWRESEDNYSWAVNLSPQTQWTAGPDGAILTVGPRVLDQLGMTHDDALGQGWLHGVVAEQRSAVSKAWATSVLNRTPFDIELQLELKDGSRRWFRTRAAVRIDRDGQAIRWYGVIEDIHDAKLAELAAKRSTERLENVLTNTADLIFFYDAEWRITYVNHPLKMIPFYAAVKGKVVWDALPHLCGTEWETQLRRVQMTKKPTTFEWFFVGLGFWAEVTAFPTGDEIAVFMRNIAERRLLADAQEETRKALDHQAHHDVLTGLPNRLLLQKILQDRLVGLGGTESAFALLHIGLDGFKHVNDTLGPAVGDRVLSLAAKRLSGVMNEGEVVARLGGDTFGVMQSGVDQPLGATALAERLATALSLPFEIDASMIVVGASVGMALAPRDGMNVDKLLQRADIALYHAKESGGGASASFAPEMQLALEGRQDLRSGLREGLARDEFSLDYQPLVDLASGAIDGFEALMRWRHPKRGLVSPNEFIGLAEESGIILPLGLWALRKACNEAMTWPSQIQVAVNLSPVQFRDPHLVQAVALILEETGLPPGRLKLEITESVLLNDSSANLVTLHALHRLGVLIVLDDFGTGYSSLSYLQSFPFDKLKIDQSFISRIPEHEDSRAIVRSILSLARALRIGTTAEGVERPEQLDWLRAEDCDQIQGYLFSRPMPSDQVVLYITEQSPVAAWAAGRGAKP